MTGAQTILFIAGQVAYDDTGGPAHGRDFTAQARAAFRSLQTQTQTQTQVEAGGGTLANIVKITDLPHRHPVLRGAGPDP